MTDQKKSGVPFWATVMIVAVLVAYPLSFGPACWVVSRMKAGTEWLPFVYRPIVSGLSPKPTHLSATIQWYSVGPLLGVLAIGVAVGSVLASVLSGHETAGA